MLLILARVLVILSTVAKLAIALVGSFILDSAHQGGLFILCVDYLGATMWYWWLLQHETEGQTTFRRVLYYLAALTVMLLVIAIVGILRVSWVIALEISRVSGTASCNLFVGDICPMEVGFGEKALI
ncbi:hypothetical protein N7466_001500 [Penicillium verhagenii]|uniref:uncharacterized protein n=1 Tax=Penicillium verhagenii TaxID=1562060 RepID=UPI0025451788|nr:uncharacterized protein N7466_001500 [Penicillium verhagenii]KAJ5938366.1 hypothetical protein N7466_001500 [Penicillium verhagenii]